MTDIEYIKTELLKKLDDLAIDDLLRLKAMLYIEKSFESEESLDRNTKVLNYKKVRRVLWVEHYVILFRRMIEKI